jgi:hypothetical protein
VPVFKGSAVNDSVILTTVGTESLKRRIAFQRARFSWLFKNDSVEK